MKRFIALMTTAALATGMLSSCRKTYPYDTDKAISLATEYMKNKYGKDIKDIESYKKTHGSDAYIGVKFKLDETDAETPDTNTYEVRVYVDGEGKENHYVRCDNYMGVLFNPYFNRKFDELIDKNGIKGHRTQIINSDQYGTKAVNYFLEDFSFEEDNSLEKTLGDYSLNLDIEIMFSDKGYNDDYLDTINAICSSLFDDDSATIGLIVYRYEDYEKLISKDSDVSKNDIDELKIKKIKFRRDDY